MNEKELMKKYPGEMIDPRMIDEEAKRSQYMYGSDLKTTLIPDINNEPPKRIAVIGGPRAVATKILAQAKELGIEATATPYDESELLGQEDMKMLSTAALGMKHLSANPYSNGRKPHIESEIDSNRKLDRTKQKNLNKKQGYGKRLTKKVKAELAAQAQREKNKQTIVVEYQDTLTLNRKF